MIQGPQDFFLTKLVKRHDWAEQRRRIESGRCRCGRPLVEWRCAKSAGGCGRFPAPRPNAPLYCECMSIAPRWRTTTPPIYPSHHPLLDAFVDRELSADLQPWNYQSGTPRHLLVAFAQRMLQNIQGEEKKNVIALFYGGPGSAKSYSAMAWAEMVDPTFRGADAIQRILLSRQELLDWLQPGKLKRGQVAIIDEGGALASSRASQSWLNRYLSETFQTNRQDGTIIFVCVPNKRFLEVSLRQLAHWEIECLGVRMILGRKWAVNRIEEPVRRYNRFTESDQEVRMPIRNDATGKYVHDFFLPKPQLIDLAAYEAKKFSARNELDSRWKKKLATLEVREGFKIKESVAE